MTKAIERTKQGRRSRLRAELSHHTQNLPVNYSCVYKKPDHAAEYLRGWNSVTHVDIDVPIFHMQNKKVKL